MNTFASRLRYAMNNAQAIQQARADKQRDRDQALRDLANNPFLIQQQQQQPTRFLQQTCNSQWIGNQWRTVCN